MRALRAHCSEGRLTVDELDECSASAYAAVTLGDLAALVADLPDPAPAAPVARDVDGPEARSPAPAGERVERVTATLSTAEQGGVWQVPRRLVARATLGECRIDLRRAEIPDEVHIDARTVLGEIKIYVPAGARVQMTGRAILGERVRGISEGPSNGPRIHVDVSAILGEVTVDVATTQEKWMDAARRLRRRAGDEDG